MRLESVIFTLEDTLFEPDGSGVIRADVEKFLTLLKFEGVVMYGTMDLANKDALALMKKNDLDRYFKGIVTSDVMRLPADSAQMFERALVRLHTTKMRTVVFSGHLHGLEEATKAGFRTIAVKGAQDEAEWEQMKAIATESVETFGEYLK